MAFTKENPYKHGGRPKGLKNKSTEIDQLIKNKAKDLILQIIENHDHKDRATLLRALAPYCLAREKEELSDLDKEIKSLEIQERKLRIEREQVTIDLLKEKIVTEAESSDFTPPYLPGKEIK